MPSTLPWEGLGAVIYKGDGEQAGSRQGGLGSRGALSLVAAGWRQGAAAHLLTAAACCSCPQELNRNGEPPYEPEEWLLEFARLFTDVTGLDTQA